MRTYQYIRAGSGFEAIGNSLVVGTAFIWVPLAVVLLGYEFLQSKVSAPQKEKVVQAQRSYEQSPEERAAKEQAAAAIIERKKLDTEELAGLISATATGKLRQRNLRAQDGFNASDGWSATVNGTKVHLFNAPCYRLQQGTYDRMFWTPEYNNKVWRYSREGVAKKVSTGSSKGCYITQNELVIIFLNGTDEAIHMLARDFEKGSSGDAVALWSTPTHRSAATKSSPMTVEQAQARYDRALATYNELCRYGCGGEPLKQWIAARDNLARVKMVSAN